MCPCYGPLISRAQEKGDHNMGAGANKGHLGGLDKVIKIRDHHHRIHRQKLRQNEGLILILAQS